ncbi:MAG: VanZ family protein [Verrucomicrobiota bacterium]
MTPRLRLLGLLLTTRLWVGALLAWAVLLYLLSSAPLPQTEGPELPFSDKIAHFLYFAGGGTGLLLALAAGGYPVSRSRALFLCALLGAAVGWLDEWHQSFTPGRSGQDVGDWVADVLGALAGGFLGRFLWPLFQRVVQRAA